MRQILLALLMGIGYSDLANSGTKTYTMESAKNEIVSKISSLKSDSGNVLTCITYSESQRSFSTGLQKNTEVQLVCDGRPILSGLIDVFSNDGMAGENNLDVNTAKATTFLGSLLAGEGLSLKNCVIPSVGYNIRCYYGKL